MKAVRNVIDSEVLGHPVFDLRDVSEAVDFAAWERDFIEREQPRYLGCRVSIEDLATVHRLESLGFRWLEVLFRSTFKLRERFDVSTFPYVYSEVSADDREEVLEIARTTFTHDRFSRDPDLQADVGGERYRRFVDKSIEADDEFAFKLLNPNTEEIVGFHTYAYSGGKSALFFIAGVKPEYKMLGLGTALNYYALNEMHDRGIRRISTHQSVSNFPILNLEVGHFGFRIVEAFVALRKLYPPGG